jgi:hypothetical protein
LSRCDGESELTVRAGFGLWRSVWRSAGSTYEALAHRPELGAGGPGGGWVVTTSERQYPLASSDCAAGLNSLTTKFLAPYVRRLVLLGRSARPRATSAGALALWRSSASERTRRPKGNPLLVTDAKYNLDPSDDQWAVDVAETLWRWPIGVPKVIFETLAQCEEVAATPAEITSQTDKDILVGSPVWVTRV